MSFYVKTHAIATRERDCGSCSAQRFMYRTGAPQDNGRGLTSTEAPYVRLRKLGAAKHRVVQVSVRLRVVGIGTHTPMHMT